MRKFFCVFALVMAACLPAAAQQQPIRVNCGGPSYTDSKAQIWQADAGYNTGTATSTSVKIAGTPDPQLFQTARIDSSTLPLIYTFHVLNGKYHVNLYFAETSNRLDQAGARVFNVKLQGNLIYPNLDIFAAVGADAPLVEGTDIAVTGGAVTIEFDNVVHSAKIDAIEILPEANSSPALTLNFVHPDGTPVAGTLAYTVASSLLSFRGSVPLANGQATCNLLSSPSALGISAQFQVNLSLTDTAGHVLWQLAFGMNPAEINFGVVQSSALKVVVQKM